MFPPEAPLESKVLLFLLAVVIFFFFLFIRRFRRAWHDFV